MISWVFAACVTAQVFGAELVVHHTPILRRKPRKPRKRVSLASGPYGVPEVVEDEVRPAVRYLGIAMMVVGGVVAGWVLELAKEESRPAVAPSGLLVPEPEPCRDTLVDGTLPRCPDLRQRVAWYTRDQFKCECVKEDSL